MTREQVIKEIKARMADLMPEGQSAETGQQYIDAVIDSCVPNFLLMLPVRVLPVTSFINNPVIKIANTGDGISVYRIPLPTNFIRLIEFKIREWNRPVFILQKEGDPVQKLQYSKYTFGGNSKPVCALINDGNVNATNTYTYDTCSIEFYTYSKVALPVVSTAKCCINMQAIQMPEHLRNAYYWYAASVVLTSMEETEFAKAAITHTQQYISSL